MLKYVRKLRLLLAVIVAAVLAGCGELPREPVPQYPYPIPAAGGSAR